MSAWKLCLFLWFQEVRAVRKSSSRPQVLKAGLDQTGCAGAKCGALCSTEFDYIVVGSGAGGGPLAARLAESGHSVLVLEAGVDAGETYEYQIPINHAVSTETEGLAWHYFVDHYSNSTQAQMDTKMTPKGGIMYPRGGTLGGSTSVNAMIQVLPKVSDWEKLVALTNDDGFSPENMLQYEQMLDGWVPKKNLPLTNLVPNLLKPQIRLDALKRLLTYFVAAFDQMGEVVLGNGRFDPFSKFRNISDFLSRDINSRLRKGNVVGTYGFPQQIKNGARYGARERLIRALDSGKLTIKTQALVSKVVFSNTKADGTCEGPCIAKEVVYLDGRALYGAEMSPSSSETPKESRVVVRKGGEIILSAGVFNTPQLLKQSGIGPKNELDRFGIPVHVDLVGVGENLQDRYEVTAESQVFKRFPRRPLPFVDPRDCNFEADPSDMCFADWAGDKSRKGLYSTNGAILAFLTRSGMTKDSDLHIFGLPGPFRGYAPGYSKGIPDKKKRNIFSWVILKGHTDNRGGTVKLRCARKQAGKCVVDPRATPDINFHYFEEGTEYDELNPDAEDNKGERDLASVVKALELVHKMTIQTNRKMLDQGARVVETWPGKNFAPGEKFASRKDRYREFVKREAWGHHASCSAPMGCIPSEEIGTHNSEAGVCKNTQFNQNTVLNSRFQVRGTQGLRVVDASAWTRIPGTFLLLPTYMLSEKAAATILDDRK